MQSHENTTTKTESSKLSAENTADDTNPKNTSKSQPVTQVQKGSLIANLHLPEKRLEYGLTLIILTTSLFVVAIYYGIINP